MNFHPKVTAGAMAGAVTALVIAEAARRGVTVDGGEGAAITLILSFIAGYFMPSDPPAAP